eukprot:4190010-Amphidinium_carterae.1
MLAPNLHGDCAGCVFLRVVVATIGASRAIPTVPCAQRGFYSPYEDGSQPGFESNILPQTFCR